MTNEEFDAKYPLIQTWMDHLLADHAAEAQAIDSLGFTRLPQYFPPEFLASAKVVYVDVVPTPPLRAIGLNQFADFENLNAAGITYRDTFFSLEAMREDEAHHFHELIHVIQWQVLGAKSFVAAYADGLERVGYRQCPLEVMAYTLESVFRNSDAPFDSVSVVRAQLTQLYLPPDR